MTVIFDGLVWTSYAQMYFFAGAEDYPVPENAFVGQVNGLCGATVTGALFLITGTHTGDIPVRVVVLESAPELGEWEEIVEVSLIPLAPVAGLFGWDADASVQFDLPATSYRVRWSASGMDAGKQQDVADESRPAPDHYELALWPAPPSADAIVRRTGEVAGDWHDAGFN